MAVQRRRPGDQRAQQRHFPGGEVAAVITALDRAGHAGAMSSRLRSSLIDHGSHGDMYSVVGTLPGGLREQAVERLLQRALRRVERRRLALDHGVVMSQPRLVQAVDRRDPLDPSLAPVRQSHLAGRALDKIAAHMGPTECKGHLALAKASESLVGAFMRHKKSSHQTGIVYCMVLSSLGRLRDRRLLLPGWNAFRIGRAPVRIPNFYPGGVRRCCAGSIPQSRLLRAQRSGGGTLL